MTQSLISEQIMTQIEKLGANQQLQVLDFAKFIAQKNLVKVNGKELLRFAGKISPEDAELMIIVLKFKLLSEQWYNETEGMSFIAKKINHPAYQEIISMGKSVIPLILAELANKPTYWFTALTTITGANPMQPEQIGKIQLMTQSWLNWGQKNGYQFKLKVN